MRVESDTILNESDLRSLSQLMRETGYSAEQIVALVALPDDELNEVIRQLHAQSLPSDAKYRDKAFLAPLINVLPLMDEILAMRTKGYAAKVG